MLVRTPVVLGNDCSRSRENCARRWLVSPGVMLPDRLTDALSVATSSSPFPLIA